MKLKHLHVARISDEDRREIKATADKLGLSSGEITRRSLRIALPILRSLNIPGSPRQHGDGDGPEFKPAA